jgi:two-component system chemotaxis response regulator CheY
MKTVLIVDDSATMRRSIQMSLELSGLQVVAAQDGQQALELIRDGLKPDLVLTDIMMPRMDGLTLIAEARKLLRFTPIVALTTQGQRGLRDRAKSAGATAWMIKPVGGTELMSLLKEYLGVDA